MCRSYRSFKPIPDEEGTETRSNAYDVSRATVIGFKPIPDEEGTETRDRVSDAFSS